MSRPELVGKKVKFAFSTHPEVIGTVMSTPSATGDCWYIKLDEGGVLGVQQFNWVFIYPDLDEKEGEA